MKVIHPKQFPSKPPLLLTLVMWLWLDRIKAPGWAWGVTGTILVLLWIATLYNFFKDTYVTLKELQ